MIIAKKRINIPIYFGYVDVYVLDTMNDPIIPEGWRHGYASLTENTKTKTGIQLINLYITPKEITIKNVSHEIVHIVNMKFQNVDVRLDYINDEPQAYFTGFLTESIWNFLEPHRVKK